MIQFMVKYDPNRSRRNDMEQKKTAYPLRLESSLAKWVKERAKKNDWSMNAELARMIRQMKEAEEAMAA